METAATFQSKLFPSLGPEEGVNEEAGIYGKRLAQYLAERLPKHGIQVGALGDEDWGWMVEIVHDGNFEMFVGCGTMTEDEDNFRVFVHPETPVIRKLFKKIDISADLAKVTAALRIILESEPGIQNIEWD